MEPPLGDAIVALALSVRRPRSRARLVTLPWPEHVRPPLVGFACSPFRRLSPRASTPGRGGFPLLPSASSDQLEVPFRPRGLAPPRRLSPHGDRGLVASRSRPWGSPRFRVPSSLRGYRLDVGDCSPRRESHPSKDSPRRQPFHVTVVVASLPLSRLSARPLLEARRHRPKTATDTEVSAGSFPRRGVGSSRLPELPRRLRFQRRRFARGRAGSRLRGLAPLASP